VRYGIGPDGHCIANSCVAGACENDGDCSDYKDCTSETCLSDGSCESVAVADGAPCAGGICQSGECVLNTSVLPCTEQAIRNAVAAGGDEPYRFDCAAAAPVVTKSQISVCGRAVLDGQGALTIDGNAAHIVFNVTQEGSLELRGIGVTNAGSMGISGGPVTLTNSRVTDSGWHGIYGDESVTLTDSTVARNGGVGVSGAAVISVRRSTISGNLEGGISAAEAFVELTDSTVSRNVSMCGSAISVVNSTLTLTNSTISGDIADDDSAITFSSTVLDGACIHTEVGGTWTSGGYNIESPGNSCGFDQETDQVNVSAGHLNLGELVDNGGPTDTHALLPGSMAIDVIPPEDCVDADGEPLTTDQRGKPRPSGTKCDVGSFEAQQ
jgi:hypothetical protein